MLPMMQVCALSDSATPKPATVALLVGKSVASISGQAVSQEGKSASPMPGTVVSQDRKSAAPKLGMMISLVGKSVVSKSGTQVHRLME